MAGANVTFSDTSTPTGAIASWSWDFGDGSPLSTVQNPVHVYAADGIYTVTLTVIGEFGGTNSASQIVEVNTVTDIVYDYV